MSQTSEVNVTTESCLLCYSSLRANPLTCASCLNKGKFTRSLTKKLHFEDIKSSQSSASQIPVLYGDLLTYQKQLQLQKQELANRLQINHIFQRLKRTQIAYDSLLITSNKIECLKSLMEISKKEICKSLNDREVLCRQNAELEQEILDHKDKVVNLEKHVEVAKSSFIKYKNELDQSEQFIADRKRLLVGDLVRCVYRVHRDESCDSPLPQHSIMDLVLPPLAAFSSHSLDPVIRLHSAMTSACILTQTITRITDTWSPFLLCLAPHLSTKNLSRDSLSSLHHKLEVVLCHLCIQYGVPYQMGDPLASLLHLSQSSFCEGDKSVAQDTITSSSSRRRTQGHKNSSNSNVMYFDPHHVIAEWNQAFPPLNGGHNEDWVEIAADYTFPCEELSPDTLTQSRLGQFVGSFWSPRS